MSPCRWKNYNLQKDTSEQRGTEVGRPSPSCVGATPPRFFDSSVVLHPHFSGSGFSLTDLAPVEGGRSTISFSFFFFSFSSSFSMLFPFLRLATGSSVDSHIYVRAKLTAFGAWCTEQGSWHVAVAHAPGAMLFSSLQSQGVRRLRACGSSQ